MKIPDLPTLTPFRVNDKCEQWYNQFVFLRIDDSYMLNIDTGDVGEVNRFLEIEEVKEEYVPGDPERIKRYFEKRAKSEQL